MTDGSFVQDSSSNMESACDDDELFFGPITDRERVIKENFEKRMQERGILMPKLSNLVFDDVSEDSIYESFSTESKYDSFEDSLYGVPLESIPVETDLNPKEDINSKEEHLNPEDLHPKEINASNFLSEQVNTNVKKQHTDKKSIAGCFCDSLEDIHSLVSSADKFSLSEEIEDINIMEISHTCEDSLMNDICIANKNSNSNEQCDSLMNDICGADKNSNEQYDSLMNDICEVNKNSNEQNFDEDSLAIFEYEKVFDDSLEDSNGPSLSQVDSLMLSKSKACDSETSEIQGKDNHATKTYFEKSIDVIYENSKEVSVDVQDIDNISPSISESHNLSRDSLEDLSELPASKAERKLMRDEDSENLLAIDLLNNIDSSKKSLKTRSSKTVSDMNRYSLEAYKINNRKSSPEFLKPLNVLTASNNLNFNETICIDDSILPSNLDSFASDATFTKSPAKASKFADDCQMTLKPPSSNDTICIDDSIILPTESISCSYAKNKFLSRYSADNDLGSIEVEKPHTGISKLSILPSSNDTICIEDSIMEYSNVTNKGKTYETAVIANSNIVNFNETISIDDSIILPLERNLKKGRISSNKSTETQNSRNYKNIEKDFQKLRISGTDKNFANVPPASQNSPVSSRNTVIDIVVRSPLRDRQKKTVPEENSNTKNKIQTPQKVSAILPEAVSDRNVKFHIEVAIDKDQGVNVVSVKQSSLDESCNSPAVEDKCIQMKNTPSKVNISNRKKRNCGLKSTVTISPSSPLRVSSGTKKPVKSICKETKIGRNRHSGDFHVKVQKHDAKLLQALDLHDTSINSSQGGQVQSRDSIMPLNLCLREKSLGEKHKIVSRNESKENIPFISSTKFNAKELNIPKYQKAKDSPKKNKLTPLMKIATKQLLNNNSEGKSGGKINSTTKIPIRKMDNAPSNQQKLEFKPSSNLDKPIKSPFVTPACPSAPKDAPGETPKKNHHFCMVRNSISKLPKSSQKNSSKKFQNIQSPIAKYIGTPTLCPPLKTNHQHERNFLLANMETSPFLKTPKNTVLSSNPGSLKADKKF